MEILRIENLCFKYPTDTENAVNNISISVNEGEFVVVCGESGCGKTTLLKLIKKDIAPHGEISGKIFCRGLEIDKLSEKERVSEIGYVLQNPENQIVTDKVWHELSFGLENLGLPTSIIRRRVGEMASYFGIQDWYRSKTDSLSGGQKQLLNLASVMVMQPKILILDEPTSQLDPIAAADFIATLQKLNRELGLTIILSEHRLEDVFPIADKILVMEKGSSLAFDSPRNIAKALPCGHKMIEGLPSAVRIFNKLNIDAQCPLTVKEGRDLLKEHFRGNNQEIDFDYNHSDIPVLEMKNLSFRYEKESPDVLRDIKLTVYKGEIYSVLGGNGTGKSTFLKVISGLEKAYKGKIIINGKPIKDYKNNSLYRYNIAYLPQNPQTLFLKDTVLEDFEDMLSALEIPNDLWAQKIENIFDRLDIKHLSQKHPFDLSGGEQQKVALAKLLLLEPKIILLDEPTKGLDPFSKKQFADILKELKKHQITVIMVTHDVEFAALVSDRCSLFFDGEILSADIPERFFSENNFYTTAANRIARDLFPYAVTCDDVVEFCK